MPTPAIVVVVVSLSMVALVVAAIFSSVKSQVFAPLAEQFPFQPPGSNAEARNFQSISADVVNLGFCVHFAIDDAFVHMMPGAFLRMFGCRACSVPVQRVKAIRQGFLKSRIETQFGNQRLVMPRWVVEGAAQRAAVLAA
jgi:hypothetical protein